MERDDEDILGAQSTLNYLSSVLLPGKFDKEWFENAPQGLIWDAVVSIIPLNKINWAYDYLTMTEPNNKS